MSKPKNERTVEIQKSLETRVKAPIAHFDSRKYIQHNLALGDGLGPILELMDALPADRTIVTAHRSFVDGDHSVAHLDYVLGDWGPMVGFEVHRWEDDRIVEHWDNLQPTPATPNPASRTMVDGASEVTDRDRTDANKALVEAFTRDVLIAGGFDAAPRHFRDDILIQHAPRLGDGATAWMSTLGRARQGEAGPTYARLHKVLGEGSLVLAMSEGTVADGAGATTSSAFYDLYRVENGAIAEHWEVVEAIPPREAWKNDNGKF